MFINAHLRWELLGCRHYENCAFQYYKQQSNTVKDWHTITQSSQTAVWLKSGVTQNNFCLQRKKKISCPNAALRLFSPFLCIHRTKLVLPLRSSKQISKIWQLNFPNRIHWAKIRLIKNKARLFSNSQISFDVLRIASWGQRSLNRRPCECNITYRGICTECFHY